MKTLLLFNQYKAEVSSKGSLKILHHHRFALSHDGVVALVFAMATGALYRAINPLDLPSTSAPLKSKSKPDSKVDKGAKAGPQSKKRRTKATGMPIQKMRQKMLTQKSVALMSFRTSIRPSGWIPYHFSVASSASPLSVHLQMCLHVLVQCDCAHLGF
jgi:hypothetical protein